MGFLLYGEEKVLFYCVRTAPRLPEGLRAGVFNYLGGWVWVLLAGMVIVMFLAWNLIYLSLATVTVSAFFTVLAFILTKPLSEEGRKRWIRK
jgi:cell division protein FtsW (lipid II flippase)